MKKRNVLLIVMLMTAILTIAASAASASNIAGTWNIDFNSYKGTMEISGDRGYYSGRFNLHGNWEEMLDLRVDGNGISFRRASADQRYHGGISGSGMSGSFTQGGSGNYPWRASRAGGPPSSYGQPSHGPSSPVAGTWQISFNSYPGTMEIRGDRGRYSGRFSLDGNWEEMLDLRIDGNRISFYRANADQRYQGRLSGGSMSGNFTQGGSGNYPWQADRTGEAPSHFGPPPSRHVPPPSQGSSSHIAGMWQISFNNYPGTMEIRGDRGRYSGRFNLHGNWEEMLDLRVDGNRIWFRRASADQRYQGWISGRSMSGNFTQGGSGNYPWRADRR